MVMFITQEWSKFTVSTVDLKEDMDGGEDVIEKFREDYEAGKIDLAAVYPHIDNDQLAGVPEINRLLALKGITTNDANQRG